LPMISGQYRSALTVPLLFCGESGAAQLRGSAQLKFANRSLRSKFKYFKLDLVFKALTNEITAACDVARSNTEAGMSDASNVSSESLSSPELYNTMLKSYNDLGRKSNALCLCALRRSERRAHLLSWPSGLRRLNAYRLGPLTASDYHVPVTLHNPPYVKNCQRNDFNADKRSVFLCDILYILCVCVYFPLAYAQMTAMLRCLRKTTERRTRITRNSVIPWNIWRWKR